MLRVPIKCVEYDSFAECIKKKVNALKKVPCRLYYQGNLSLLESPIVAIMGTRKPNQYTKIFVFELARRLTDIGVVVISGGAIGVDILAHKGAQKQTIMIAPSGLNYYYPSINIKEICKIAQNGLVMSEYDNNIKVQKWTFLERNRLILALSDCVVIPQADIKSGSLKSAYLALEMKKPLFVFPHRMGESLGTHLLIKKYNVEAIVDIDSFLEQLKNIINIPQRAIIKQNDAFLEFCSSCPSQNDVIEKFGISRFVQEQIYGTIIVSQGRVMLTH